MHIYRIMYTDNVNNCSWIDDPNICTKTYKPLDVRLYHYPGCDENSAITTAKLFFFDSGFSKETLNFVIQSFDDSVGFWENIFECKAPHRQPDNGVWD